MRQLPQAVHETAPPGGKVTPKNLRASALTCRTSTPKMAAMLGESISHYRVLQKLGGGGAAWM
jgi:hypothetical protein